MSNTVAGYWISVPEDSENLKKGEAFPDHKVEVPVWVIDTSEEPYIKLAWYDWKYDMWVFVPGQRPMPNQKIVKWLCVTPPRDV
jgi:hypothetical protein